MMPNMVQKRKIKVAVLMGGSSAEHEVSLHTGEEIAKNLDPRKYIVEPVTITKTGTWIVASKFPLPLAPPASGASGRALTERAGAQKIVDDRADIVFIALHGKYGEDGTVQGLLESFGIPYTGSGVLASALGMDKPRSLGIFREAGLTAPDFLIVKKGERFGDQAIASLVRRFSLPFVVKPANHGSSIGVAIVRDSKKIPQAIREASRYSDEVIAQKYVRGRELTCGVLELPSGKLFTLPPIEIVPKYGDFYDYESKYADGGSEHLIPPPGLAPRMLRDLQKAARTAHQSLGCRGMSRTDFILGEDGIFYVLEINTIPGMTSTSLLPQAAAAAGISFPKLLDMIIVSALRR